MVDLFRGKKVVGRIEGQSPKSVWFKDFEKVETKHGFFYRRKKDEEKNK